MQFASNAYYTNYYMRPKLIEHRSAIYRTINIEPTLRCNATCKNCYQFVNHLDHSDTDMTIGQIRRAVSQIRELGDRTKRPVFDLAVVMGGEALLHPDLEEMVSLIRGLLKDKYIRELKVLSNMILQAPETVQPYVMQYTTLAQKIEEHRVPWIHPDDLPWPRPTYAGCHERSKSKYKVILSKNGFSVCCKADGYSRLFGAEELFLDYLPDSLDQFPLDRMSELVCQHCAFACDNIPDARDRLDYEISKIYKDQLPGHKINRIFTEEVEP